MEGGYSPSEASSKGGVIGDKIESRGEEGKVNTGNGGKEKGITRNNHFTCNFFQLEN